MLDKAHKIAQDPEYLKVVALFQKRRKGKKIARSGIETATQSGGGRVSNFEALNYTPTLITFIKWCRIIGVQVIFKESASYRRAIKKAVKEKQKANKDPGKLIVDLQRAHKRILERKNKNT